MWRQLRKKQGYRMFLTEFFDNHIRSVSEKFTFFNYYYLSVIATVNGLEETSVAVIVAVTMT